MAVKAFDDIAAIEDVPAVGLTPEDIGAAIPSPADFNLEFDTFTPPALTDPSAPPSIEEQVDREYAIAGQHGVSLDEAREMAQLLPEGKTKAEDFWEGATIESYRMMPFFGSVVSAHEIANVLASAKRLELDDYDKLEPIPEALIPDLEPGQMTLELAGKILARDPQAAKNRDIAIVNLYADKLRRISELKGFGKFGRQLSVVPAWMIEFYLTGGLKHLAAGPTKKFITKHLKSKIAGRLTGWVAGGAVRTTLGMPHRVVEKALQRRLQDDTENWASSVALAWGDVYIEVLSEETGAVITKGISKVTGGIVGKLPFGKKFIGALQAAWMQLSPDNTAAKFVKQVVTKGGYHGIVGEIGEERLATLLHGLVGTEDFGAGKEAGPLARIMAGFKQDWENKYVELGVFGTIGGGQIAAQQVAAVAAGKPEKVSEPPAKVITKPEPIPTLPQTPEDAQRSLAIFQEYLKTGDEAILEDLAPGVELKITPEDVSTSLAKSLTTPEARQTFKNNFVEALGMVELGEAEYQDLVAEAVAYQKEWGETDPLPEGLLRYVGLAEAKPVKEVAAKPLESKQGKVTPSEPVEKAKEAEQVIITEFLAKHDASKGTVPAQEPFLSTRDEKFAEQVNAGKESGRESALFPGELEHAEDAIRIGEKLGYKPDDIAAYLQKNYVEQVGEKVITKPQRESLKEAGFSLKEISEMTPQEATELLGEKVIPTKKITKEVKPTEPVPVADLGKTISKQLKQAKVASPEVTAEQQKERKRRVGAAAGSLGTMVEKGVTSGEALERSKGQLKGKLTRYFNRFESIREELGDIVDRIYDAIVASNQASYFEKINLKTAFDDLIDGSYLTPYQAELVSKYLGADLGKAARKRIPAGEKWPRVIAEIMGIPTTTLTALSGDMSGIMRQARPLGQAYPKEFITFVSKYAKAWGSEESDIIIAKEIRGNPFYEEVIADGILEIPRYGEEVLEPFERGEEFIGARPLEKIPGIGQLVKMAERGFITGISWFRISIYSRVRTAAQHQDADGNIRDTMPVADRKRLAGIINDASGRSHIKRTDAMKRWGPFLQVFFAPRFRLSRMRLPFRLPVELGRFVKRLAKGERLNVPEIRMTAGAFSSMIATNLLLMYLVRMAYMAWGGDPDEIEFEDDSRSRNFGKMSIRNMSLCLYR